MTVISNGVRKDDMNPTYFAKLEDSNSKCAGAVGSFLHAPPAPSLDSYEKVQVLAFDANKQVSMPYEIRILVSLHLDANGGPFVEYWELKDHGSCMLHNKDMSHNLYFL